MEGGNDPSIVAVVPTSFGSDFILRSVYPTPSSEFSFSLELEGNNAASTVVAFPPSSAFFSFAVKLEGGTAPSSVAVVPPSSVIKTKIQRKFQGRQIPIQQYLQKREELQQH